MKRYIFERLSSWSLNSGKAVALIGVVSIASINAHAADDWSMGGQDISNSRSQAGQSSLSVQTASHLALKWSQTVKGDVSATPAIVQGAVYFPDWGGYLNKLDASSGKVLWQRRIDSYAGEAAGAVSRTSPAVVDGVVYIGDQKSGSVLAIDATTGNLRWRTTINSNPFAIVTQSPLVLGGVVYVGASSLEEGAAAANGYACCTFRGSFSALDANTGAIKWTTYTIPSNGGKTGGYSGGAVWGSSAAIDPKTGTVSIATGNNYAVPDSVKACQQNGGTPAQCLSPEDYIDAILALDMKTGAIKWSAGAHSFDDWNVACIPGLGGSGNCPPAAGPDFDFGSGPNLFTVKDQNGKNRLLVGAGQKSGVYWQVDALTGAIQSSTIVGPGSSLGGIEWGTATDGKAIYVANSNQYGLTSTVNGVTGVFPGTYAAIEPFTGKILWQTVDPSGSFLDLGAVSVSNGVLLAGSMSGHMYALNGATGQVLWDYAGQGSSNAGPAIDARGTVYWGNGYANLGLGSKSFTFYAFSVNGK